MTKNKVIIFLTGIFVCFLLTVQAAKIDSLKSADLFHENFPKNEFGIDAAQIMPLFRKQETAYLINYKRYFGNENLWAIRSGANLDFGESEDESREIAFKLGIDRQKIVANRWRVYFGIDASYSQTSYNDRANTIQRYGVSPLLGFRFHIAKYFSIATEPHLNFFYHVFRNPDSFSNTANKEEQEISLGSIGLILVNFHF